MNCRICGIGGIVLTRELLCQTCASRLVTMDDFSDPPVTIGVPNEFTVRPDPVSTARTRLKAAQEHLEYEEQRAARVLREAHVRLEDALEELARELAREDQP